MSTRRQYGRLRFNSSHTKDLKIDNLSTLLGTQLESEIDEEWDMQRESRTPNGSIKCVRIAIASF